jgi:hypothetical protein
MNVVLFSLQKKKEQIEVKKNLQSVVDKTDRREKTLKNDDKPKEQKDREKLTKTNTKFKDNFLFEPKHSLMKFYDTYMLLVIGFSCFSSAYYCAFEFPTEKTLINLEHCVFASFTLEIIFMCMKLPPNADESDRNHLQIIKRYLRSGRFFLDLTATFPFYLWQNNEAFGGNSTFGVLFKLLRMVRLPKILNLLNLELFNRLVDHLI